MSLKVLQLNIELDRHLDKIFPFVHKIKPDVITMQEVFLRDVIKIEEILGMKSVFSPMKSYSSMENSLMGILVLTSHSVSKSEAIYYRGEKDNLPVTEFNKGSENIPRCILKVEIQKDNKSYMILNTHFTWTPDGSPSQNQYEDVECLLQLLGNVPEFILCGDFNAPRGGPIFSKIAEKYKDNIPSHVITTLDRKLHRAGNINRMVDGLFTTPGYHVENVEVVSGVSDHCGIVACIS